MIHLGAIQKKKITSLVGWKYEHVYETKKKESKVDLNADKKTK